MSEPGLEPGGIFWFARLADERLHDSYHVSLCMLGMAQAAGPFHPGRQVVFYLCPDCRLLHGVEAQVRFEGEEPVVVDEQMCDACMREEHDQMIEMELEEMDRGR